MKSSNIYKKPRFMMFLLLNKDVAEKCAVVNSTVPLYVFLIERVHSWATEGAEMPFYSDCDCFGPKPRPQSKSWDIS